MQYNAMGKRNDDDDVKILMQVQSVNLYDLIDDTVQLIASTMNALKSIQFFMCIWSLVVVDSCTFSCITDGVGKVLVVPVKLT